MNNTFDYYKNFKEKVLSAIKVFNEAADSKQSQHPVIKILPGVLLSMVEDIIELLDTTGIGNLQIIEQMFSNVQISSGVPVNNTSRRDVYNAVAKLKSFLYKYKKNSINI